MVKAKTKTLTADEIRVAHLPGHTTEAEAYKFVRVGGIYRFVRVNYLCAAHFDMVTREEVAEGKVESAGSIVVSNDWWRWGDYYSSSLRINATPEDDELLTVALGKPMKERAW